MRWTHAVAVLALCLGVAAMTSCSRKDSTEKLSAAEADTLMQSYAKDRADTQEWLKSSPTSYLATTQRQDFGDKTAMVIGSAEDADVRIEDPGVKPHHFRVTVVGDSFQVAAMDHGAQFGFQKDSTLTFATVPPGNIRVARFTLRLSHQRYPAIIVFDPKSPRYSQYKGIQYFPPNLDYHVIAKFAPSPHPDTTIILSTRGNRRRAVKAGWFEFTVNGEACRLEADRLLEPGTGEKDLSLFFTDATTGKESYGVGRYLDPKPLPDGRYVLDFNLCYNPACAYSEHYNCPIPPADNHLKVAIPAGEMDGHYMH